MALRTEMVGSATVNTSFTIVVGLFALLVAPFLVLLEVFTFGIVPAFVCGMSTLFAVSASQRFVLGLRTAVVVSISRVV